MYGDISAHHVPGSYVIQNILPVISENVKLGPSTSMLEVDIGPEKQCLSVWKK